MQEVHPQDVSSKNLVPAALEDITSADYQVMNSS